MRYDELLTEGIEQFYHGSPVKIDQFTLDRAGQRGAVDQEGPGIYLTNSIDDARVYGDFVHSVEVKITRSRLMPEKRRFDSNLLRKLILSAPDAEDTLTNYDEFPNKAVLVAIKQLTDAYGPDQYREVLEQVWYDFYRDHPQEWFARMQEIGWDGFMLDRSNGVKHLIVFTPKILKITGLVDINEPAEIS